MRFWVRSKASHSLVKNETGVCENAEESWEKWISASFQRQFFKRDWQRTETIRLL